MNGLTGDAKRILRRWARSDYYVYIRILSGVYFNKGPEVMMWVVNVEVRQVDFKQVRKEGTDLSAIICELDLLVPRRSKGYIAEKPHHYSGWLAPQDKPKPSPNIPNPMREARPKKRRSRV